jgi:YD repeat-containing protein
MKLITDTPSGAAPVGEPRNSTAVVSRCSSRIVVPLCSAFLVLGVSAGENALAADQIIYSYDALGRLQTVTYPNNTSVTYTYDHAGNRTQVTNTGGTGSTGGTQLPQQRRKMAALQAILSILLGN